MLKDYAPRIGMGVVGRRTDMSVLVGFKVNGEFTTDYRKACKMGGKITPVHRKIEVGKVIGG